MQPNLERFAVIGDFAHTVIHAADPIIIAVWVIVGILFGLILSSLLSHHPPESTTDDHTTRKIYRDGYNKGYNAGWDDRDDESLRSRKRTIHQSP